MRILHEFDHWIPIDSPGASQIDPLTVSDETNCYSPSYPQVIANPMFEQFACFYGLQNTRANRGAVLSASGGILCLIAPRSDESIPDSRLFPTFGKMAPMEIRSEVIQGPTTPQKRRRGGAGVSLKGLVVGCKSKTILEHAGH